MTKHSLYHDIPAENESNPDIPDALFEGIGEFIREEVSTRPILKEDKEDYLLHCITSMMERYFRRFYDVLALYTEGGRQRILSWQTDIDPALREHFDTYQSLYQHISYLQEKPYHMTAWSMAYLVDSALITLKIDKEDYLKRNLDVRKKEHLEYLVDFGGRCMAFLRDNDYIN